jgi:hypothetical protein
MKHGTNPPYLVEFDHRLQSSLMKELPVYPAFTDLIRAIFALTDAVPGGSLTVQPGFPGVEAPHTDPRLSAALGGTPRKTVFIIVDGMGESTLERLEPDSFLRRNRRATISPFIRPRQPAP